MNNTTLPARPLQEVMTLLTQVQEKSWRDSIINKTADAAPYHHVFLFHTEEHHLFRLWFWPFPGIGAFLHIVVAIHDNFGWHQKDRELQCCTENPFCIPSSCKQGSDETCSQHTEDFTPVLYSEDKSSILISKAIKLTLQIIKFRPQKQEKKLTSFIPVNDTVVCAPTFQGTRWESGRTKKKPPTQGLMCLRLLQTPHGNSGAERARHSQLAVKAGSTEEISDKRALPSLDTNHNQTISGSSQTLIFPLESHNTAGSKSPPSITWPQKVTTLYLGQKSAIYYISTLHCFW